MPSSSETRHHRQKECRNLLSLTSLLRQRFPHQPRFNLFSTLYRDTDEVRLHSRFIAALLDPKTNLLGKRPLALMLRQLNIDDFSLEGIRVEREAYDIDILVTNTQRQALVIENKILAQDQPKQLVRYYQCMRDKGYAEIHVRYLTLDGRAPSEDSLGDLATLGDDKARPGSYATLGYGIEILMWLQACLGEAALHPALRESIAQYQELIMKLTGQDMENDHLRALVELLQSDGNLIAAHDIQQAYQETLVAIQVALWEAIHQRVKKHHPNMHEHSHSSSLTQATLPELCRSYIYQNRNNKWYGLYYMIPGYQKAYASIEIEHSIYFGVYCDDAAESETIIEKLQGHTPPGQSNQWWPFYSYHPQPITLKQPSVEDLAILANLETRLAYAHQLADETADLWRRLSN